MGMRLSQSSMCTLKQLGRSNLGFLLEHDEWLPLGPNTHDDARVLISCSSPSSGRPLTRILHIRVEMGWGDPRATNWRSTFCTLASNIPTNSMHVLTSAPVGSWLTGTASHKPKMILGSMLQGILQ
mmetsp:Transcript_32883/g.79905  ORF Transcript_32883/g.79905 Transcript_32883/m.79905 type:complete len:126 (+) Transcript_32883:2574-2951(+)